MNKFIPYGEIDIEKENFGMKNQSNELEAITI